MLLSRGFQLFLGFFNFSNSFARLFEIVRSKPIFYVFYVFRYAQLFPQLFAVFLFLPRAEREKPNLLTGHIVCHISFSSLDIEFQTNIKCYFYFPRWLRYTGISHWFLWIKPCCSYSTSEDDCSHLVVSIFINILS